MQITESLLQLANAFLGNRSIKGKSIQFNAEKLCRSMQWCAETPSVRGAGVVANQLIIVTKKKDHRKYFCQLSFSMAAFWPTFLQIWKHWGGGAKHISGSINYKTPTTLPDFVQASFIISKPSQKPSQQISKTMKHSFVRILMPRTSRKKLFFKIYFGGLCFVL